MRHTALKNNFVKPSLLVVRHRRTHRPVRTADFLIALLAVLVCTAFLAPSPSFAQSASSGTSLNTRLRKSTLAAGALVVKMTGQFATSPTDSYTLQKQLFVGSTNCSTGGQAIAYVPNVSASAGHTVALTSADSVLLQPLPSSDRNGQYLGFQNPDNATITYLPGNAVCVAGFDNLTKNLPAQYSPALETLDGTCTNPKFYFQPGDTLCVRVAGTSASGGSPWHVNVYGGSRNECGFPSIPQTSITSETQNVTFTLPASNSAIPNVCTTNGTVDIRGSWRAVIGDFSNTNRASQNFRLHDGNPVADTSVYVNSPTDLSNQSGFPPAGNIKWGISVNNNGPDTAPNPSLVVAVPSGTTFTSFTQTNGPSFTCNSTPVMGNITCTRASLAADSYASFELIVSYSGKANGALIPATATLSSGATDFTTTDLTSTTSATVTTNANVGQFLCRPDITVMSTSASGAVVNYNPPPAIFTTTANYTGGSFAPTPASGSVFPIGLTYIAINSIQGSGQCVFKVIVNDGQRPDLTVVKTHTGNFARGQSGVQYTMTVSNTGALSTVGLVTLTDSIPSGLILTSMSGSGWTCNAGTATCSRSDSLASGASYPPVTVTGNLPRYLALQSNFTNKAFVSGGGEGITTNDESDDTAGVTPPIDAKNTNILWRNYVSGTNAAWLMNGTTKTSVVVLDPILDPAWKMVGLGDFNGDGQQDILWRNYPSGNNAIWYMNGTTKLSVASIDPLPDAGWRVEAVADFNGDGKPDILWRNYTSGTNAIWIMNGATKTSVVTLDPLSDPTWKIVGAADFDGDGKSDVLWRNYVSGTNAVWLMNGTVKTSVVVLDPIADPAWKIEGTGDFNGDGKTDILWRNYISGINAVWLMNGTTKTSVVVLDSLTDASWKMQGIGEFDDDGTER